MMTFRVGAVDSPKTSAAIAEYYLHQRRGMPAVPNPARACHHATEEICKMIERMTIRGILVLCSRGWRWFLSTAADHDYVLVRLDGKGRTVRRRIRLV